MSPDFSGLNSNQWLLRAGAVGIFFLGHTDKVILEDECLFWNDGMIRLLDASCRALKRDSLEV